LAIAASFVVPPDTEKVGVAPLTFNYFRW
jgi:hypothetical protein